MASGNGGVGKSQKSTVDWSELNRTSVKLIFTICMWNGIITLDQKINTNRMWQREKTDEGDIGTHTHIHTFINALTSNQYSRSKNSRITCITHTHPHSYKWKMVAGEKIYDRTMCFIFSKSNLASAVVIFVGIVASSQTQITCFGSMVWQLRRVLRRNAGGWNYSTEKVKGSG